LIRIDRIDAKVLINKARLHGEFVERVASLSELLSVCELLIVTIDKLSIDHGLEDKFVAFS